MADLDDKVIKTKTGFLDELLGGLPCKRKRKQNKY